MTPGSMLLVLPVPFRMHNGELLVEAQAANGLDRWADHFTRITVAAPLLPESEAAAMPGMVWRAFKTLEHRDRITCMPLPQAYTPWAFARHLHSVRRQLTTAIAEAQHLQFAIGGIWGDWAAVAATLAMRQGRKYAIHTDRVEHELMRRTAAGQGVIRRIKIALEAPLMERYHHHLIQGCSLGLWHGDDCYRAYAPWCGENHLVHDIHTKSTDLIDPATLKRKAASQLENRPLEVCYAGRLDPMKAPLEWVQALAAARAAGACVQATWYGEGALRADTEAEARKLAVDIHFAGFVAGREQLLGHIRTADLLVFTHITPESPRNLLEALVCGTPIVGYESAYAQDLLKDHGGGALVPLHDAAALGRLIATLDRDRPRLAAMTLQAAANGRRFTDAAVFAQRSDLVHRFA